MCASRVCCSCPISTQRCSSACSTRRPQVCVRAPTGGRERRRQGEEAGRGGRGEAEEAGRERRAEVHARAAGRGMVFVRSAAVIGGSSHAVSVVTPARVAHTLQPLSTPVIPARRTPHSPFGTLSSSREPCAACRCGRIPGPQAAGGPQRRQPLQHWRAAGRLFRLLRARADRLGGRPQQQLAREHVLGRLEGGCLVPCQELYLFD
jgi:hypothetical protein